MNVNMFRDLDDNPGFWAAACATNPDAAWSGTELRASIDAGASYQGVGSLTAESTIGTTTNALADFLGGNIPDEVNAVTVRINHGTLSSTTFDGLLAGINAAVIGDEIVYFRTATLTGTNTYRLSGLLRGRRGSEYAMGSHAVGDRFVLINIATMLRVAQSTADLSQARLYKAMTTTLAAATAKSFTNEGAGLRPYSPVHLGGGKEANDDWTLNWTRRGRLSGEWRSSVDVPLGETTEAYEVDIWADSDFTTLKRTISVTSQSATYTAAQQTTDFGGAQTTVYFSVQQLSSVIGRGYAAFENLTTTGTISPAPAPMEPAPAPAPTPAPAPPPVPGSAVNYPFGDRLDAYAVGIAPAVAEATMDGVLTAQYDAWKAARVVDASSVVAGGKAVQFTDTAFMTVSEGMGYGMLLAVLFAGHDAGAKTLFDGLLAVVRARPAFNVVTYYTPLGQYLMEWKLNADGSSINDGYNAMDGDLDIAMALLMADRQWGSHLAINYKQEAINTINAMKAYNFKADGTTKGLSTPNVSRTSDYMIGHFRAFAEAIGDTFWSTTAVDRALYLSRLMQTSHSFGVGLMPDFIINTHETPIPSTGGMGDGNAFEHHYWWNACRNPWRFASDYLLTGDVRVYNVCNAMVNFFKAEVAANAGDITAIGTGYRIVDGVQLTGGDSPAFHAPILAGACVDAAHQSFANALWTWNAANLTTGYYDGEIQLLSMVVASGNWWTP